jgi:hypothetical protein
MPFQTRYYNLEAFKWGEVYSSVVDKRRFTIIDNQLELIADQIGSGLIIGWDIIDNQDETVTVTPGMGLIDKRIVQSFGGFEVALSNNSIYYFYMEAKAGVIGGISGNSNIVEEIAEDVVPPASPSGLVQVNSILDYLASLPSYGSDFLNYLRRTMERKNEDDSLELIPHKEIAFKWDANQEKDFSHYLIKKASQINPNPSDPSAVVEYDDFKEIANITELIYIDVNLSQNSSYRYQVVAVDYSGNESVEVGITISTDIDDRIPSPPINVQIFPSDETLQVIWDHSPTDNVSSYRVTVQPLDSNYNIDGDLVVVNVSEETEIALGSTYVIFENLENNKNYEITVYAVNVNGFLSEGISTRTILEDNSVAGEVNNIDVQFSVSEFENVGLETTLFWRYERTDPYLPYADKFLITFAENGNRLSEPIEVLETTSLQNDCPDGDETRGACYQTNIKYIPYRIDGKIKYESIKEHNPYLITIQTADENDNVSNGVVLKVARTPISQILSSITDFTIERQTDNSLFLEWVNPLESYFSHNLITVSILDLTSLDDEGTNYVEKLRIDKAITFTIPPDQFSTDYRYTILVDSYDVYGNAGESYEIAEQFVGEVERLRPSSPFDVNLSTGDTEIYLQWSQDVIGEDIDFYKIYRANFSNYFRSSAFVLINTVPASSKTFTDYTVVNSSSYTYIVTAVDIFGIESLNPIEDGFISIGAVSGTPSDGGDLDAPTGLVVSSTGDEFATLLTWDTGSGVFDGYEILKSVGNNYSFNVIDYVVASENSYTDQNSLLKDGETYYYLIRKYRNEVNLNVKSSSTLPLNSILIGKVTTFSLEENISTAFNVDVDVSSVVHLENLEDPLTIKTNNALAVHHHTNDNNVDKRIELRSNVTITDWETEDYQVYSTEEDIGEASSYILQISGTLNESYFIDSEGNTDTAKLKQAESGESPVLYAIDIANDKITFNEPLYSARNSFIAPYSSVPSVSLQLLGIAEVDNYLQEEKVKSISATQFESGQLLPSQMPSINHEGRMNERLLPLSLPMQTLDNYVYSLASLYQNAERNLMGTSVAFYDIIDIGENRLLAATSNGIWLSNNYGSDWSQVETLSSAVHQLYFSNKGEYYAITNYGVYKNRGTSFRTWDQMSGLEYVKTIRDITEDGSNNLYVSTDLGVFKLNNEFIPYIEDTWQKLPIFGARSSEAYALIYDDNYIDMSSIGGTGRVLVSNELGLLQSLDEGRSWNYINDLEALVKIRMFIKDGNYIFALSDDAVYRENQNEDIFTKIGDHGGSSSRQMAIFNSKIYVSTDDGIKVSVSDDIYNNSAEFISSLSFINIKNNKVVATCIKAISGEMLIGTDRVLYVMDINDKIWVQFEERETVIPSFYVDGEMQKIGFYYNNGGSEQNVSFDEYVAVESKIEVANKYDMYLAEYKGWADLKYNAKFEIYSNDFKFAESKDDIVLNVSPFVNVVLPEYTDDNAHKEGADKYKLTLENDLDILTSNDIPMGENLVDLVSDTYLQFELFLSQIYEDSRVVEDSEGNISNFVLPPINTDLIVKRTSVSNAGEIVQTESLVYSVINEERGTSYNASANVVDGFFTFDLPFDKYDNLILNIYDATVKNVGDNSHREVEDIFERAYSGHSSYLSQVQQVNIVKIGLFTEKQWPNEINSLSTVVQADHAIPVDNNWYDTLNSTINYNKEVSNEDVSLSITYPSAVAYISEINSVFVGGKGGVLSIDKDTLNIEEVNFGNIGTQLVRSFLQFLDVLYIVTDKNIFFSNDDGSTWEEYNKNGLPNQLYSMGAVNNNLIIGAEDGVYIKLSDSNAVSWGKVKESNSPVNIIYTSNILYVVIDGKIYLSSNGFNYVDTNVGEILDITDIEKYGFTNTYISANQGLYSDNGTFNSYVPVLEKINLGEFLNVDDTVNCVATNDADKVVAGLSNGSYILIENNVVKNKEQTSLDSIHEALVIGGDEWLFGQDSFKVPSIDYPIKLSTGIPL